MKNSSQTTSSTKSFQSRDELIKVQNKLAGSEQRNKRMLGMLLGTLKQFKTEDKEHSASAQVNINKIRFIF